jgi:hypothetical protein
VRGADGKMEGVEAVIDKDRTSVGVFVDLEANLTDKLLASAAIRGESYSDFGETATGKLALRYDVSDGFALRGSVQNGFRAPSLQQQFFTTTSTNFIGGVPFDITTFAVSDPVAVALGAKPLDAEKATNYSLGAVFQLGRVNLTVDAYQINLKDRIVLSENLTAANVRAFLTSKGFIGIGGGRFFINGVDTETKGVDVIDCSGGGVLPGAVPGAPVGYGYQVPYADKLKREAQIQTMAVGLIVHAEQAERILQQGQADLVALAREMLYNPNWTMDAAQKLGLDPDFNAVPPPMAYWLERRRVTAKDVVPSTFGAAGSR